MNTVYRDCERLLEADQRCGDGVLLPLHECAPPGWWSRLSFGVRAGQLWRCDCHTCWRWNGAAWRALECDM